MKFGAHCSTAGGPVNAVKKAVELECESLQIFTRNQRQWSPPPLEPEQIDAFKSEAKEADLLGDSVSHASYLINLAATDDSTRDKGLDAFVDEMERAHALGLYGVCLHPGAHVGAGMDDGIARIADGLKVCLDRTRGKRVKILLENTAGQGTTIGARFEEIGQLLKALRSTRVKVLIDTCHAFAAGYDFRTDDGYEAFVDELDAEIGIDQVVAFHLNDSKHPTGSRKDRHENIGRGEIGEAGFERLLRDERFNDLPGILETPGAPDAYTEDLKTLRRLAGR